MFLLLVGHVFADFKNHQTLTRWRSVGVAKSNCVTGSRS